MADLLNNYVKFVRGSQAAYDALGQKDPNTLYFITDDNKGYGGIYLGNSVISGGDIVVASASLDDLADVILSETGTNSFLVRNEEGKWVSKSLTDIISLIESGLSIDPSITEDITNLQTSLEAVNGSITALEESLAGKANVSDVETALNAKANATDVADIQADLALKASAADLAEVQNNVASKANIADVESALAQKADAETVNAALDLKANALDVASDLELKADVADVNAALELKADIDDIDAALELKANAADVYTKTEVDNKVAAAITNADHLKRQIVDNLEAIDPSVENADQYIYMVPTGTQFNDDKYDEYIVINGAVEKVGSWEVDLKDYALKTEVAALAETVNQNKLNVDASIEDLDNNKADKVSVYIKDEVYTKSETLAEIAAAVKNATGGESAADVLIALDNYKKIINAEVWGNGDLEDSALTSTQSRVDLLEIAVSELEGAEVNFINSVDETELKVENKKLSIISVDGAKIDNLVGNTEFKVVADAVAQNTTDIENLSIRVKANEDNFDKYVLKVNYESDIKEIRDVLTWKEMV